MNWFPVPRYRAVTLYLVTRACGHSGVAEESPAVLKTGNGWFRCPHCESVAKQAKLMELPVTWDLP